MRILSRLHLCVLGVGLSLTGVAAAQAPAAVPLDASLSQSAKAGQYTLIVFHRDGGEATQRLHRQTADNVAGRTDAAVVVARVDDPANRALVEKFGIARAPMPMTVVVAPNGAVTGLFVREISPEQVAAAIVTPTMMRCMKELQDQKLVFVCCSNGDRAEVPLGVQGLQLDPQFKSRVSTVGLRMNDPAEARFYRQLQLDPAKVTGPHAALIAPPGMLIGHFDATATPDQIAAAIHKAGKCCDDANCKHNHAPQASGAGANRR